MDLVFYYNLNYDIFDINAGLKKYKIMASSLFIEKMITKFQSHQILMFNLYILNKLKLFWLVETNILHNKKPQEDIFEQPYDCQLCIG